MVETVKDNIKSSKLLNCYNLLPLDVKGHFNELSEENFSAHLKDIIVEDVGNKGYPEFSYLYCSICESKSLPKFLEEFNVTVKRNNRRCAR